MVSLAARFSPSSTLICPAGNRRRPSESNVSCLTVCTKITFSPALQSRGCLQEPYRHQLIIRRTLLLTADLRWYHPSQWLPLSDYYLVRYMCSATATDHAAILALTVPLQLPLEEFGEGPVPLQLPIGSALNTEFCFCPASTS
jgi:hypothetical protein